MLFVKHEMVWLLSNQAHLINLLTNIEGEKKDLVCCYLFSLCALHDNLFHGMNLFHCLNFFHTVIFVSQHKYGVINLTVP